MFLPLRFNKILSLFLLSSCSFNVMAFSDVDKGGQIRATGFQSELSGILTTRLLSLGADAATVAFVVKAYSQTAADFVVSYAARSGVAIGSMTWANLAYGLGVTAASVGLYALGKPVAESFARMALSANGYDVTFATPAMTASDHNYWCGIISNGSGVYSTSPWSALARMKDAKYPGYSVSYSSLESRTATWYLALPGKPDDPGAVIQVGFNSGCPLDLLNGSDDYPLCDNGEIAVQSEGATAYACEKATTEPVSFTGGTGGLTLDSSSVADVLNALSREAGQAGYVNGSGLTFTSEDVDSWRSHNDFSSDSTGFTDTSSGLGLPATSQGDTADSGGTYSPPVAGAGAGAGTGTGTTTGT
ncbi:hypothetical protein SHH13_004054, partial [Escherichia coli]|nr:hypothetical protein [Escherichia coli]